MPHKGYKQTKEEIEKKRQRMLGHIWNRGKKRTEEYKKKLSERISGKNHPLFGTKMSEETKRKISLSETGKKDSIEVRQKKSIARMGEKNPSWKGGVSFEIYPQEWSRTLKRSIRERDNYVCQLCSAIQGDISFDIHHIDYNKKNCNPINLITLCRKCHTKTNYKREYWLDYFNNKKQNGTD